MAANFPTSDPSFTKKDYVNRETPLVADYNQALEEIEAIGSWLLDDYVPKSTTADLTFYVNPSTGNDNNNGSSGSPFATIAKAISLIPQIVNHDVTINVADGNYDEGITLSGYVGKGSITVTGNMTTPANVVLSGQVYISRNSIEITVQGLETTTTSYAFCIHANPNIVTLSYVVSTSSSSGYGVYAYRGSKVRVSNSTLSNKLCGIHTAYNGIVTSVSNGGTDNTWGLGAISGLILKYSTQPGGTTAERTDWGGQIW